MLRPLGDMEYTYWLMGISSPTSFTIVTSVTGELPEALLRTALNFAQKRHPLLNATIQPDRKHGAVFVHTSGKIPFASTELPDDNVCDCRCGTALTSIMEHEKAWDFFRDGSPLLRCHLLRHAPTCATILFTFHHAVADAASAVSLVEELFTTVTALAQGNEPEIVPCKENGPLEKHIDKRYRGFRAFLRMNRYALGQNAVRLFPGTVALPADRSTWPDECRERFILSSLDRQQTTTLLDTAGAHDCSIHAALCAAHLLALVGEYPDRRKLKTLLLSLVNLRNHPGFITPPASLNLMISMIDSWFSAGSHDDLWRTAEMIQNRIRQMLQRKQHLTCFPMMCHVIRATHWLYDGTLGSSRRFVRSGQITRPQAITLSNIGKVTIRENYGLFSLHDLSYLISLSTSGIFGAGINTFSGRLNWNFTYADPALSESHALQLAQRSRTILIEAC